MLTGTQDDATRPSWQLAINSFGDNMYVQRAPAGSTSPTSLLTLDSLGMLSVPGYSTPITYGSRTAKAHLIAPTSINYTGITYNAYLDAGVAWQRDDTAQVAYRWLLRGDIDMAHLDRVTVAGASGSIFWIYGNTSPAGDLQIGGNVGTKNTGTTWANPSDIRLKKNVSPYERGLADILRLDPISYTMKACGTETCGFDAEKVRDVFPECVSTTKMKLDPEDEEETDDVLVFDMHPILVALVNAVKELAGKVGA